MGAFDTERAEQPETVVGHVAKAVGNHREGGGKVARTDGCDELAHVDGVTVELGGQPAVAVVVSDHVAALVCQCPAEVLVPAEHLRAETHHEQDGRVLGVTEALVRDGHLG